jgi:ABC-2 type transport system permease protein
VFRAVVRVEWRSALRDRALLTVLLIFAALVAYAAVGGRQLVLSERRAIAQAEAGERERFQRLRGEVIAIEGGAAVRHVADPRSPHLVGRELLPRVAALPLSPLAGVAVGQRDLLPQTLVVTTQARFAESGRDDGMSPSRRASGPFDLAFVLVFLLPLVVLAASYDLLSVERERGTLALVLSQPVSLATFVLGKAVPRAALLVGVTLALAALGAMLTGAGPTTPGAALDFSALAVLLAAYTLFWFALAVAINAWGRSSAANALSLVAAWLALAIVIPGLTSVVVDTLHPTPSRAQLLNLARETTREASSRASALEGNHGVTAPRGRVELGSVRAQRDVERELEPVVRKFEQQLARQQALVDRLRFLSPVLLLHEGVTDVAGSGVLRNQDFSRQVGSFHQELQRFFFSRVEAGRALGAADYDAMPRFEYRAPGSSALLWRVGASVVALALMTALLVAVALWGLRATFSRGLR